MNPKGFHLFVLFLFLYVPSLQKKLWVETYMFKWVQPVDGLIGSVQILSH